MPPLELHPRLPQELREKILTYVVEDEIIGLEYVSNGKIITDINYDYQSSNLKKLMDDEDARDQLQHLIYERGILDLERSVEWKIGRDRGLASGQTILRAKLRHFRRIRSSRYICLKNTSESCLTTSIIWASHRISPTVLLGRVTGSCQPLEYREHTSLSLNSLWWRLL